MPTNCHTKINDNVTSAVEGKPSQGANHEPNPTAFSNPSATPHSGERIRLQVKPTITTESNVGRNINVRYVARKRRPGRLKRPASAMPIGFCTTMCTQKRRKLFKTAFQNGFDQISSVNSVTKLARPTNT